MDVATGAGLSVCCSISVSHFCMYGLLGLLGGLRLGEVLFSGGSTLGWGNGLPFGSCLSIGGFISLLFTDVGGCDRSGGTMTGGRRAALKMFRKGCVLLHVRPWRGSRLPCWRKGGGW